MGSQIVSFYKGDHLLTDFWLKDGVFRGQKLINYKSALIRCDKIVHTVPGEDDDDYFVEVFNVDAMQAMSLDKNELFLLPRGSETPYRIQFKMP